MLPLPMQELRITATLTATDWQAYMRAWSARCMPGRATWLPWVIAIVMVLTAAAGAAALMLFVGGLHPWSFLAGFATLTAALATYGVCARRSGRPDPDGAVLGHQTIQLLGTGIYVERPRSRATYDWAILQEVTQTPDLILLWIDRIAALIIPKRDLPAGVTASEAVELILALARRLPATAAANIGPTAEGDPGRFGAEPEVTGQAAPPSRSPFPGFPIVSDASIVVMFALSITSWLVMDRLRVGDNAELYLYDVSGVAWYVLAAMLIAWIAARLSNPKVTYRQALFLVAAFAPLAIAMSWLLAAAGSRTFSQLVLAVLLASGAIFLAWGLRRMSGRYQPRAVIVSLITAIGIGWASEALYVHPTAWYAVDAAEGSEYRAEREEGERLLFEQAERIDRAVGKLASRDPGVPNVFFLGFAGYGEQRVFADEIELAARVIGGRYGSHSRSLRLVNDRRNLNDFPLATVTGLRRALLAIRERMDRDQDILFLVLSSHGSEGAQLSVSNGALPLRQLSGAELAAAIYDAGIRWKVIVISACFSGAFIPSLQDDQTIVLTASAPDRTSFGCSDDRDLTYFGEAFFRDALPQATSLREAFAQARESIGNRERTEGIDPSYPQAFFGAALERHLGELE